MKRLYLSILTAGLSMLNFTAFAQETNVTAKFIKNPSFENQFTNWTQENMQTQTNTSFTLKAGNTYAEKWVDRGNKVGNASVYQLLKNLPAGKYRLEVAAHNIQQESASAAQTGAVIYADADKLTVTTTNTYKLTFATLGGSVEIGFKATNATGNWLCIDNFRLFDIGAEAADLTPLLANKVTDAEKLLKKAMQPSFSQALTVAVDAAKEVTDATTLDELKTIADELVKAYASAEQNVADMTTLKSTYTKARTYLARTFAEVYREPLQTAYDEATPIMNQESDANIADATKKLEEALEAAMDSYTAYAALTKAIRTASNLNKEGKEGVEAMEDAIAEAQAVLEKADATPAEMDAATVKIENATLLFRVENGIGNMMNVKTLNVVQGATEIYGRASFSGPTAREKGFCYSEHPEPTVFDARSTASYSNNGEIYVMAGMKPATVYYVRAYAITTGYQLSYGDVVKTVTRPMGNVTFSYGYEGDDATNTRIYNACEEAVWMWNNVGGIQKFHLDAHYRYGAGAGTGTAECSYGGYMSVSQNTGCQRTGTILHEGAHGLGMVPYTDWTNSIYRSNGDRGEWLGARVDRMIQFLDDNSSAQLHGDNQHMWPYGINGSGEDTGSPILYRANALLVEALSEDGIRHSGQSFLTPAYTFEVADNQKYYIKSEDAGRGLATSFLRQKNATLRFEEMTADEAFSNDSCAWTITFNPRTCFYTFTNVATGYFLFMSAASPSLSRTSSTGFQLLPSRQETTIGDFTFAGRAYWLVSSLSLKALNANASNFTGVDFNHANSSTTQRWLLLTGSEVTRFAEAQGETVGIGRNTLAAKDATLRVAGGVGTLTLSAVGSAQDVQVAGLDGRVIRTLYIQADAIARISLPRGIYLVGGQKVVVR